jgi:hypothetical protein
MHDLADWSATRQLADEMRRRHREGLPMKFDSNAFWNRAYEDAINAYARTKIVQIDGTETPPA